MWYGVVGCVVTYVVGWLASLLISWLRPGPAARRQPVTEPLGTEKTP